jgi:hypothetical protein
MLAAWLLPLVAGITLLSFRNVTLGMYCFVTGVAVVLFSIVFPSCYRS